MRTFSIYTLGCKVNQYESQQIAQLLEELGLSAALSGEKPDLAVINTCCVTGTASAKSRQYIQRALKANPAGVRDRNLEALRQLTEGLMLSGFAMQSAKSSRPASGAEHQFSHLWDMQHHVNEGRTPLHGFKVGIGTLAVAGLYEYLLARNLEDLDVAGCCARWPDEAAGEASVRSLFRQPELTTVALRESRAKWVEACVLRGQLETLRRVWPGLKERLRQQLIPLPELKTRLRAAGAPVEPEEIGISRERLRASFQQSYYLRRRFTVLDLAARCSLLEPALSHLFGPAGPWPLIRA